MYTLLYLDWITAKDLLQSTRNLLSYAPGWMGLGPGGEWILVYVCPSLFAGLLKLSQHS